MMLSTISALRVIQRQSCLTARFSTSALSKLSDKTEPTKYEQPSYATRSDFDRHQEKQRRRSADAVCCFIVSKQIRRNGTMNRMHDRLRVVFIVVGIISFFLLFFAVENWNARRISRDRNLGKTDIPPPSIGL